MKILVIGAGGREHALAWKLAQSPRVSRVFVAPGNAGTAREDGITNVPITDIPVLVQFANRESIALTVVGPEAPLAGGIVDAFQAAGLKIFGPTRNAARLESSKDFAKSFMARHGIPTARHATFDDAAKAHEYVDHHGVPIVIKADGLAAGKGVVVATTVSQAHAAIDAMLAADKADVADARVVIEEFLEGEEASFIVMADGRHALALATSQDHKRLGDGDAGPNTGGMGAYSPALMITPGLHGKIMHTVVNPVLAGMEREGMPYTGFLYAGLMIDRNSGIRVLEFNCRLGDPETQPIMLRLKSDLTLLLEHALAGTLDQMEAEWDPRMALGVVAAAHGYPGNPRKGDIIDGLPQDGEDFHVFHAGTAAQDGHLVTSGGRVLCITALGHNIRVAQQRAYEISARIRFPGMQMRRDIGYRALVRKGR